MGLVDEEVEGSFEVGFVSLESVLDGFAFE